MKKTQTIVDRERLGSDYIESKQDFSNVLSQVKQLSTTTWNNPWFYGPIGIAVFAVTVSIVSFNPTIARVADTEPRDKEVVKPLITQQNTVKEFDQSIEVVPEELKIKISEVKAKKIIPTTTSIEEKKEFIDEKKLSIIELEKVEPIVSRKVPINNKYPHIEGVFTGEISLNDLFAETGIQLNPRIRVTSFEFNYFNGKSNVVQKIEGNTIPTDLHGIIELYNLGQMIFITNIKAVDEMSRVFTLPSLNYKPFKN